MKKISGPLGGGDFFLLTLYTLLTYLLTYLPKTISPGQFLTPLSSEQKQAYSTAQMTSIRAGEQCIRSRNNH